MRSASEIESRAKISSISLKISSASAVRSLMIRRASAFAEVKSVRPQKNEAEVLCGNIRVRSKISDLSVLISERNAQNDKKKPAGKRVSDRVQVSKNLTPKPLPSLELNVIGMTVQEALPEVEAFIDGAVCANLEEVRIVHGVGTGKLRAGIQDYLKKHRNVEEFRLGKYGEGETGVTIVKIK